MLKKKIIIAGAGLAGLSAAWHLAKYKSECLVFEKETLVGGLCRSKTINEFTFDYDAHLLHFKYPYTFNLVKNLLGNNLIQHQRNAFVHSSGCLSRYPFQANLYGLPAKVAKECLLGFLEVNKNRKPQNKKAKNFLDWINQTFGKGIAKYFMVPYNEKFWTVPARELTCAWLDDFIPVPSLEEVMEGAVEESRRQFGYNAHFFYPQKGGIAQLPMALASEIENIHTQCSIKAIDTIKKTVKLSSGDKIKFDWLISTIPLPELAHLIKDLPRNTRSLFKQLRWNSIFNLNLGIDRADKFKRHWIYFPERKTSFFRLGFPHNFSSSLAPDNKSSLYAEVAYSQEKPINKKTITSRIKNDLQKASMLLQQDKITVEDTNDIYYGYPIYDTNYQKTTQGIFTFLYRNKIIPCGRYGAWQYLSMEGAILDGKRKAREALCYR